MKGHNPPLMPQAEPEVIVSFAFSVQLQMTRIRRPIVEDFVKVRGISMGTNDPASPLFQDKHRLLLIRPWLKKSAFRQWMFKRGEPASLQINILNRQSKVAQAFFFKKVGAVNWFVSDLDANKSDLLWENFEIGYSGVEVR